ncbi:MAG TPA: chemotaxis response regulator protein-glutamate methylesterase [Thiotrichales bacterium]|nr:chemotaxis response regulator protein-glutamate methylesterase [Thiotrichales bacterium]
MSRIRVLIVDDSALIRKLLTELLSSDPSLEVVGTAPDPYVAREKIKQLHPDVLTLDVEMPRMDGLTFLRNLMRLRPMPVVMISTLTEKGAEVTLQALALGAVDFVAKPKLDVSQAIEEYREEIVDKVKAAAKARVQQLSAGQATAGPLVLGAGVALRTTNQVIAFGASTGGTEAIRDVLSMMPADSPPIVIVQHIPELFSTSFAARLDSACAVHVTEAKDGQTLLPGHAVVAPGGRHLEVFRDGARYACRVFAGERVNRHIPSVDVLFHSVADHVGSNAIGIMLTGMGNDGAQGMLAMRDAGAYTLAQDEKSSVVWGMPGSAVRLGAVDEVLSLQKIAPRLMDLLQHRAA